MRANFELFLVLIFKITRQVLLPPNVFTNLYRHMVNLNWIFRTKEGVKRAREFIKIANRLQYK